MREGVGLELGDDLLDDDLLDDGVPAVDLVGLDRAQGGVGDERVVAVGGEQLTLGAAVTGEGLQPPHPAHHQPARHVLGLAAPVKATKSTSATSASETHRPSSGSNTACG